MNVGEDQWRAALAALETATEVALGCHVDPDGDALGSMLALGLALRRRGVAVTMGWGSDVEPDACLDPPAMYAHLPGLDGLVPPRSFPAAPQVFVALDCATPDRLGALRPIASAAGSVIVIDHHAVREHFGDVRLVDAAASATAVIVLGLLDRLGASVDRELATCLYTGIVTDTGRFTYASTTPDTLRLAARLMETGIDHVEINRQVWDTHALGYLKLLARALERATTVDGAGLVYTVVRSADRAETGVPLAETEGIIDVVRSVEDAECALVLRERDDGSWKASLRSKVRVDVGAVAGRLGGGGHRFAAGFDAEGPVDDVVARIVEALREQASELAKG